MMLLLLQLENDPIQDAPIVSFEICISYLIVIMNRAHECLFEHKLNNDAPIVSVGIYT